jgi:hypothetical protein
MAGFVARLLHIAVCGGVCLMQLNRQQSQKLLNQRGIWVTEACDKCGQLLGPVRWTRKGERGEWCSQACRDGMKVSAPKQSSKKCRECGVSLTGKRADSEFCAPAHRMRFRKSQTGQNCDISAKTPIGKQGLTEAQNGGSTNTLTRPTQTLETAVSANSSSRTGGYLMATPERIANDRMNTARRAT